MCGISGIINKDGKPVSEHEISSVTNLIRHRGPDSEGYFFGPGFALGNRRLSIIDLSDKARQPMSFRNKLHITYNGEIYNYREIRQELERSGYTFMSDSDTEVILAAYDRFGVKCVSLFNGMWAFALYDSESNTLFCSRDRFGVKPFYYYEPAGRFIFGSEIKQLIGYCDTKRADMGIVMDYLVAGYDDHTNRTFFEGIQKLEQSHNLLYSLHDNKYSISRYYEISIDRSLSLLDLNEAVSRYMQILRESVSLRLRSDVTVGTCLSGGLDSSSIAAIASDIYHEDSGRRFTAVTAGSTEPEMDERHYSEIVSEWKGLSLKTVVPTTDDFRNNIDRIVSIQEEPFISPSVMMQLMVFEKARESGCKVMLDGQGGDETLLGYERYYPAWLISLGTKGLLAKIISPQSEIPLSKVRLLLYLLYFTRPSLRIMALKNRFRFIRSKYFEMVDHDLFRISSDAYSDITALQKLELTRLQLPHLLKYEDRNSMINSIEARLPFLDYRCVETALSINNNLKIRDGWTKYVLRKGAEDILPPEITWRRNKIGFNAPESTWMGQLSVQIRSSVLNSEIINKISDAGLLSGRYDSMDLRTKWRLFNIAKWEELFNVTA